MKAQYNLGEGDDDGEEDHLGTNTRSLPRHFKLATHKQGSTLFSGQQHLYNHLKDKLFVTKALALVCPLPLVQAASLFLTGKVSFLTCKTVRSIELSSVFCIETEYGLRCDM